MNNSKMFDIIKKELRDIIRDKKTLMMMIVLPLLLYPVMIGAICYMMEGMASEGDTMERNIGIAFEADNTLASVLDQYEVIRVPGTEEELKEKLKQEEILAYITKENNVFTIFFLSTNTKSTTAMQVLSQLLEEYNKLQGSQVLVSEGIIPDEIFSINTIAVEDISGSSYMTDYMLNYIPSIIIMMATMTAGFAAIDMTAGEKERGTLETILTFPLKKLDIIGGKFVATVICTSVSSILGFSSMYTVLYILSGRLTIFENFVALSAGTIALILLSFICFAILISAASIMLTSRTKSFKEAQNSIQPLTFISIVPMFLSIMGTKMTATYAMIPFLNITLLLADILKGTVNIKYYLIMVASTIVIAALLIRGISKLYKSDKILFS